MHMCALHRCCLLSAALKHYGGFIKYAGGDYGRRTFILIMNGGGSSSITLGVCIYMESTYTKSKSLSLGSQYLCCHPINTGLYVKYTAL